MGSRGSIEIKKAIVSILTDCRIAIDPRLSSSTKSCSLRHSIYPSVHSVSGLPLHRHRLKIIPLRLFGFNFCYDGGQVSVVVFGLGVLLLGQELMCKRALRFDQPCAVFALNALLTWKALRNRKTRSYASFGGRRFRASCTVSFSSGIKSSALCEFHKVSCDHAKLDKRHHEGSIGASKID